MARNNPSGRAQNRKAHTWCGLFYFVSVLVELDLTYAKHTEVRHKIAWSDFERREAEPERSEGEAHGCAE